MFDFPTNPASGTVVMVPDGSYRVWDSTKWRASPSSSTITTGPFLPIAGGVMTGALSLFGNATQPLHAVPLQQLNAGFLPLSGGLISGQTTIQAPLYVDHNFTYSGTAATLSNQILRVDGASISGVSANTDQFAINTITNTYQNFQSGQGTFGLLVVGNVDAGSWMRSNVPLYVSANQVGQPQIPIAWATGQSITAIGTLRVNGGRLFQAATTGTTGATAPTHGTGTVSDGGVSWLYCDQHAHSHYQVALGPLATCNFNVGGAAGAPVGENFGAVIGAGLQSGATFYNENVVLELDDFVNTGASVNRSATLQLVKIGQVQGTFQDWGISFSASSTARWRNPIIFQSAVDANGYAIAFQDQNTPGLQTMAGAIDMQMVTPTGNGKFGGGFFMRWPSGGMIDQSSNLRLGYATLNQNANGLTIDVTQRKCTGVASIASGGTGWATGMWAGDQNGNYVTVTAAAGVVTAATLQIAGYSTAAPSGAQTFSPVGPNGNTLTATGGASIPTTFTANLTYAAAGSPGLTIGSAATPVTIGGAMNVMSAAITSGNAINMWGSTASGPANLNFFLDGASTAAMHGDANWGLLIQGVAGNAADLALMNRSSVLIRLGSAGLGFNNTAGIAKPTVSGAKGSNAALGSLLTALAAYGLITDSSTA
jgi:hypothetical protein